MPYRRRYYRSKSYNKDKYSIETSAGQITIGENFDASKDIVPAATVEGMRKVKHLTINFAGTFGATNASNRLYWGIVYVPEGYTANALNISGQAFYEPNQFLMAGGVLDFDGGPTRIYCPLSRNLNSGDKLVLVVKGAEVSASYQYVVRYAITLQ